MRYVRSGVLFILAFVSVEAQAYSGGNGTQSNPFQIAKAQDLIDLGNTPADYKRFFVMTADIDLAGITFEAAVIAPNRNYSTSGSSGTDSTWFRGRIDGQGHVIKNLIVNGNSQLGLVGRLGDGGVVCNLGVTGVTISGLDTACGGLIGVVINGVVENCFSTGVVKGRSEVGGLVGTQFKAAVVRGSLSRAMVSGNLAGGLVGYSSGSGRITSCYCEGMVSGSYQVGGLVGMLGGVSVVSCYSQSSVHGDSRVGGLIGGDFGRAEIVRSFWNVERAGTDKSAGGAGLDDEQIRDPQMLVLNGFDQDPNWVFDIGQDSPSLVWEHKATDPIVPVPIMWVSGSGTSADPFRISALHQLYMLRLASALWDRCFSLESDLDLDPNMPDGQVFSRAVLPYFSGQFMGNGHTIHNLHMQGASGLGFFGVVAPNAEVSELRFDNVSIEGTGSYLGALAASCEGCRIVDCASSGMVSGADQWVGGLIGRTLEANVSHCFTEGKVEGKTDVGGLIGDFIRGTLNQSWSTAHVHGAIMVGGLVGTSVQGDISDCYSQGEVRGVEYAGGLAGRRSRDSMTNCYSVSPVTGAHLLGGIAGETKDSTTLACFWDVAVSGQTVDAQGLGLTTSEMQTASTFLNADWDFVGEAANGIEGIWTLVDSGYPELFQHSPSVAGIQIKPMEGMEATQDDGEILSIDTLERLYTGTSSFSDSAIWPIFSAESADDLNLGTVAVTDGQTVVQTRFDEPMGAVVILTRGLPATSVLRLTDNRGQTLGEPVVLAAKYFSVTQYTCMGRPVYGVVVRYDGAFDGTALSAQGEYLMGLDIVAVLGLRNWASQGQLAAINGIEATHDDGEILSIDGIPVESLILGTTSFPNSAEWPIFPPEGADNFDLMTLASTEQQSSFDTLFDQFVTEAYLIIRPYLGDNVGLIELLDDQGDLLSEAVAFNPESFTNLGYSSYGQEVQGLKISANGLFCGIRVRMEDDKPLVLHPVSISGKPQ
jgi:hypothetical protein